MYTIIILSQWSYRQSLCQTFLYFGQHQYLSFFFLNSKLSSHFFICFLKWDLQKTCRMWHQMCRTQRWRIAECAALQSVWDLKTNSRLLISLSQMSLWGWHQKCTLRTISNLKITRNVFSIYITSLLEILNQDPTQFDIFKIEKSIFNYKRVFRQQRCIIWTWNNHP